MDNIRDLTLCDILQCGTNDLTILDDIGDVIRRKGLIDEARNSGDLSLDGLIRLVFEEGIAELVTNIRNSTVFRDAKEMLDVVNEICSMSNDANIVFQAAYNQVLHFSALHDQLCWLNYIDGYIDYDINFLCSGLSTSIGFMLTTGFDLVVDSVERDIGYEFQFSSPDVSDIFFDDKYNSLRKLLTHNEWKELMYNICAMWDYKECEKYFTEDLR